MIFAPSNHPHWNGVSSPKLTRYRPEGALLRRWLSLAPGMKFRAVNGEAIYLLEGGEVNLYDGPDITRAKLLKGAKILMGDVEFHVREGDWFAHEHDKNQLYKNVILHVVSALGKKRAKMLTGREIATIIFAGERTQNEEKRSCQLKRQVGSEPFQERLKPLMMVRWLGKVERFYRLLLASEETRDVFYIKSFWALGLKGNEDLFERLANSLTLEFLNKLRGRERVEAVFYGSAGLTVPERRGETMSVGCCESRWNWLASRYDLRPIVGRHEWRHRSVRPAASPTTRLQFGVDLVMALLNGWEPWGEQMDLAYRSVRNLFSSSLPGRGWFNEWLGNVVLPISEAIALAGGKPFRNKTSRRDQWCQLNLGYTYGRLLSQFRHHFRGRELSGFALQQGLMELQKRYCHRRLCELCPIR